MLKYVLKTFRSVLPASVRKIIGRAGRFFDVVNSPIVAAAPGIESALSYLKNHGFNPQFIVDVGAYHDEWTVMFKGLFPSCKVLMIEPQEQKRSILLRICERLGPSVELQTALLGAVDGRQVRFFEMETGSSVYEEQSLFPRRVLDKSLVSLDQLLSNRSVSVDFLKLDVQGYELEVLRGATQSLRQAQGVLMEASLVPINQGTPLIADVLQFMTEHGFHLMDFCSQIRRPDGILWQTDLLFIRDDCPLVPTAKLIG